MTIILGINHAFHESSAAIIKNGKIIAAVAEERLNRKKKGKEIRPEDGDKIPFNSIEFCLEKAKIGYKDVDYWVSSFDPDLRLKKNLHWEEQDKKSKNKFIKDYRKLYTDKSFGTVSGEVLFYESLMKVPKILKSKGAKGKFHWVQHHLSHAASAYYPSGFETAAILVADAGGEYESAWISKGKGDKIKKIHSVKIPNSLGFLWIKISQFCGFGYYGAGKLMGLAAYGNPKRFEKEMNELVPIKNNGFSTNEERIITATNIFGGIEDLFKIKCNKERLDINHSKFQDYADIAATLQDKTDCVLLELTKQVKKLTKYKRLCLAGGIFLNCISNQKIIDSGLFDDIYISPAATDDGTAVGAALYFYHSILGNHTKKLVYDWFTGPDYSNEEIEVILSKAKVKYKKIDAIHREVAKLLQRDMIIAWFQGKAEFGPRALGNRSILANPKYPNRDRLNAPDIKDREDFRPVCPSVLDGEAQRYFNINSFKQPYYFMLAAVPVREEIIGVIRGIEHPDNTSRIQIVRKTNIKFYNLIKKFRDFTGIGMILNTSFNSREEPIVNSPLDAVNTFSKCKGIDYLAIGDFLVKR